MDDGSALDLEFGLSTASDIYQYEVYAASWSFTSVGVGTDGPNAPIMTLDRLPEFPLILTIIAGDLPVLPGQETWVAVVAVDSSANAHKTDLTVVSSQSIDDGITDPGNYLPTIEGVTLAWVAETDILVTWNLTNDFGVEGYQIHISNEDFMDISDATFVGETLTANSFVITSTVFTELNNKSAWYVSVTAFDDNQIRQSVDALMINAVENGVRNGDDSNDGTDFQSLLTTPNLLAAGLVFVSLILLVAIVRGRGKKSQKDKQWEIQTATWGLGEDAAWDSPPAAGVPPPAPVETGSLFQASERIQNQPLDRQEYVPPMPVMNPVRAPIDNDLLSDLDVGANRNSSSPGIDTSFLDDLL
jgi:hypothetical protein